MIEKFNNENITIASIYYCPHSPEDKCHCRKPETGMIEQALNHYAIDLKNSWMIGDKESDIDLALNAGIGNSIYIGNTNIKNATCSFNSILACKVTFE